MSFSPPVPPLKVIRPANIQVGILEDYTGPAIDEKRTTLFFFLILLDLYRLAVRSSGDTMMPLPRWGMEFKDLAVIAEPALRGSMTAAHFFFGLQWIWLWMANLTPGASQHSGFFERNYVILTKGTPAEHRIGYVRVFERLGPSLALPSSQSLSYASYSHPSTNLSVPFPNPFPVPESDLFLLFGKKVPLDITSHRLVVQVLHVFFEHAFLLVTTNHREMPFPDIGNDERPVAIKVESEKGTTGVTNSVMADAIVGIVYYMLHEGFFGGKIVIARPNAAGKRSVVGAVYISQRDAGSLEQGLEEGNGTGIL